VIFDQLNSQALVPALVALPLFAAIVSVVLRHAVLNKIINVIFLLTNLAIVLSLADLFLQAGKNTHLLFIDSFGYQLGGWAVPLGISLTLNGFALLMIILTAFLALVLGIYSLWYFKGEKAIRFWPLWWLLLSGLNAIFLSNDAFNIYVCLEIIGLSAAALVALETKREALVAALRYLLVGLVGSLFYLLGVVLLYRSYGTLDLTMLANQSTGSMSDSLALLLITSGLLLKIALFPVHFWLPPAHANAPTPVSAILSSLVVKAGIFVLIRFWFDVLDLSVGNSASNILGVFGGGAIIWGSWKAFCAPRLKLMIAYSTVAQLGYIFLLFPLSASSAGIPDAAATYLIVAHACAKATMFLAAGNILIAVGHDNLGNLKGIAAHQPLSVLIFAIAGMSLIGLPPSAGFIGKWLLLTASIQAGQWHWFVLVLIGGLLATLYVFKFLTIAFSTDDNDDSANAQKLTMNPVPIALHLCALLLAIFTILLGFNSSLVLDFGLQLSTNTLLGSP
jgi:formate hydrogenlyase subunit 3/multisubunit Na+/H+ antiporter MnhD subunit